MKKVNKKRIDILTSILKIILTILEIVKNINELIN